MYGRLNTHQDISFNNISIARKEKNKIVLHVQNGTFYPYFAPTNSPKNDC